MMGYELVMKCFLSGIRYNGHRTESVSITDSRKDTRRKIDQKGTHGDFTECKAVSVQFVLL